MPSNRTRLHQEAGTPHYTPVRRNRTGDRRRTSRRDETEDYVHIGTRSKGVASRDARGNSYARLWWWATSTIDFRENMKSVWLSRPNFTARDSFSNDQNSIPYRLQSFFFLGKLAIARKLWDAAAS